MDYSDKLDRATGFRRNEIADHGFSIAWVGPAALSDDDDIFLAAPVVFERAGQVFPGYGADGDLRVFEFDPVPAGFAPAQREAMLACAQCCGVRLPS